MMHFNPSETPLRGQSRYGKLADALRQRVLQGEWGPGDFIPAEASLAQAYGVALGTMRQALALLVEEGVLQRQQGRGTLVTRGVGGASMMRFFRFRGVEARHAPPESQILTRQVRPASPQELAAFGLGAGSDVLQLERLRSLGQNPCLLETIVLPLPQFAPLVSLPLDEWGTLLYPMYQARCKVLIHRAQDSLRFAALDADQAEHLRLPAGHPCVRVERQAFDIAGRCVELRSTRGDAFSFEYTAQVR